MDISLFDYDLPPELIAQVPARERDESRLLVLDRADGRTEIYPFKNIVNYLNTGDALVVNNTRVFKARLFGNRVTGGEVEIFLVRKNDGDELNWIALAYPSRRLKPGESIHFHRQCHADRLSLTLSEDLGGGRWLVTFSSVMSRDRIIEQYGHVPLPHYIKRPDTPEDINRYQTVFARPDKIGAVAAPTAGFHFTPEILDRIREKGVKIVELTLHVGPGTFKPVKVDDIDDHVVDPELAVLSPEAADAINSVRADGGKIYAVGTTSVRTLESAETHDGRILPFERLVDLYIKPGHRFQFVDHLVTNFHLPKSSLLILVSAFAGRETIMAAYHRAVSEKFRFYSYGDAMLIL